MYLMFYLLQKLTELIEKKKLQEGLLGVVHSRHGLAEWLVLFTEQTVVVLLWCVGDLVKCCCGVWVILSSVVVVCG